MIKSPVIVIVIDLTHCLINEVDHPLVFKQVAYTALELAALNIGSEFLQINQCIVQIITIVIDFFIDALAV